MGRWIGRGGERKKIIKPKMLLVDNNSLFFLRYLNIFGGTAKNLSGCGTLIPQEYDRENKKKNFKASGVMLVKNVWITPREINSVESSYNTRFDPEIFHEERALISELVASR